MAGDEPVFGALEHRGFVLDGLDRRLRHADRRLEALGGQLHADKQAGAPGIVGVRHADANGGGARLFAEQITDVGHGATDFGAHFAGADLDGFADADLVQVFGKHTKGDPHLGQVRQGEGVAGFADHLADAEVFFHHHTGKRRAQFVAISSDEYSAATQGAHLLSGVVQGDFGFL